MGKRSRKRGGPQVADRPLPPREGSQTMPAQARTSAAGRPPATSRYDAPATTIIGRMAESWRVAGQRPSKETPRSQRTPVARPERPPGPFGAVPVSEIAMLAGLVGLTISLGRGAGNGDVGLLVSLAAIGLGSFELAAREHFAGYRSHALFLALIITVAAHAAVAFGIGGAAGTSPFLILLDVGLFGGLAWTFGSRFKRARRDLRGGAR